MNNHNDMIIKNKIRNLIITIR